MRKTIQIPSEIDTLLSEYLKDVKTKWDAPQYQGIKISKSSWVTQAIREKRDSKSITRMEKEDGKFI